MKELFGDRIGGGTRLIAPFNLAIKDIYSQTVMLMDHAGDTAKRIGKQGTIDLLQGTE